MSLEFTSGHRYVSPDLNWELCDRLKDFGLGPVLTLNRTEEGLFASPEGITVVNPGYPQKTAEIAASLVKLLAPLGKITSYENRVFIN